MSNAALQTLTNDKQELRDQTYDDFLSLEIEPESHFAIALALRTACPKFSNELFKRLNFTFATTMFGSNKGPNFSFGGFNEIRYAPGLPGLSLPQCLGIRNVTLPAADFSPTTLKAIQKQHVFPRTYYVYFNSSDIFGIDGNSETVNLVWPDALCSIMSPSKSLDYIEVQPVALELNFLHIDHSHETDSWTKLPRQNEGLAARSLDLLMSRVTSTGDWQKDKSYAGRALSYRLRKIDEQGKVHKIVKINSFILLEATSTG